MQAEEISDNVIQLTYSSETAVTRAYGNEILSHEEASVDLSRMNNKAPVLLNHNPEIQIGVVERSWIEDGKGKAEIRFSRNSRAQEVKADVLDGIMPNTSVGYRINDAEERENNDFVVTRWQPFELSIVSVPADASVGYGRDSGLDENEVNYTPIEKEPEEKKPDPKPEDKPKPEPEPEQRSDQTDQGNDAKRVASIRSIAEMYKATEDAERAIKSGESVEDFQRSILEKLSTNQEDKPMPNANKTFSIVRALNAQIDNDWTRAEYEKEIIDEIRTENTKGIAIPPQAFRVDLPPMLKGSSTEGKELVDDALLTGEFIDVLYNNSWLSTVGVRRMSGLVGDITIQKKSNKPTFGWLAEAADVSLTNFQIGTLKMNPKTMAGGVATSRRLMMQSTPSVEMLIRNAIVEGAAEAVEHNLLNATGTGESPTGILARITGAAQISDLKATALLKRKNLIDAVTAIRGSNVRGSLYAMMNAKQAGYLMNTNVSGTTFPQFILSNGSIDAGESVPVVVTEHMPDDQILIGDFSQMIVGAWGTVDLVPDMATLAASGGLVIRLWQDMDIQCRYDEAFHLIKGIKPPAA